jgi:tRNA dimethylallyltransferase
MHFIRDAKKVLIDIRKRDKIPIVCGGTGFWVQALIEDQSFPAVKSDRKLRAKLSKKSAAELFRMLMKKDPRRAETIDRHNKVRLIRALEIIATLGKVPITTDQTTTDG